MLTGGGGGEGVKSVEEVTVNSEENSLDLVLTTSKNSGSEHKPQKRVGRGATENAKHMALH